MRRFLSLLILSIFLYGFSIPHTSVITGVDPLNRYFLAVVGGDLKTIIEGYQKGELPLDGVVNSRGEMLLHEAARHNRNVIAENIISWTAGKNIDAANFEEMMSLHLAAKYNHPLMVDMLIDNGADVTAQDVYKKTPLHYMALTKSVSIIRKMVNKGADIKAVDVYGQTPLLIASQYGNMPVVSELIDLNADVNVKNVYGQTPLHLAVISGRADIVQLLLDAGAEVDAMDKAWRTPYQLALKHERFSVAHLLIAAKINKRTQDSSAQCF